MLARFAADLVLVLHFAFIVFVVLGGLLAIWRPWLAFVHLPSAAWGVFVEATGRLCPLTTWENALRAAAGEAGYAGGFIEHYLLAVIYPDGLTRGVQAVLAAAVVVANVAIYAWVLARRGSRARAR